MLIIYCRIIAAGLLLIATAARGQDTHFAGVQDMNIWNNPALKINKTALARTSMRIVKYPNIISYKSKVITFELPFVGKEKTDYDNIPFVNLAAGINTDNSDHGFLNASTAMLSLSYALPLDENNTYLAMGFQGNYSFNRVGADIVYQFPAQFDKYGALNWSLKADPYMSGFNYGYFTAGAGVALFHNDEQKQWYVGGSVRHFNHPYTEWSYSARLPSNYSIQAGYQSAVNDVSALGGYANFSWQAGMNEQFIGASYTRHFNNSANSAVFTGACYRPGNALVPDAGFKTGVHRIAFYYEISITRNTPDTYHCNAFEFSYQLEF